MSRSALSLLSLSASVLALALVGCAAAAETSDETASSNDALVTDTLVGKYYDRAFPAGGIARITLDSDGTYTASFDAAGTAECVTAPCLIPESGSWSTARDGETVNLRLIRSGAALRSFEITKLGGQLSVTGPDGKVQKLTELDADQCLDDSDCTAGKNQFCAPKVCAMMCASGSAYCCGASTCRSR
jgi:hypothetical protein